jgi:hypothetical protein
MKKIPGIWQTRGQMIHALAWGLVLSLMIASIVIRWL